MNRPIYFTSSTPIASIDTSAIRFEELIDSVWQPLKAPHIERISPLNPLKFKADYKLIQPPSTMSMDSQMTP